ncbi:transcriptional regulator, MarR family [Rhizobiales bacterium GAS191]|nr:transcriptional regulator, MarR family [Rhizobiales bacterium GAS191]
MKTADPELMRAINRLLVVDTIRRRGPIARVEISELTELSATTVSAITAALLDDKLIVPHQIGGVRDPARGRPRVLLELNPDAAFAVGVKLGPAAITIAITNFRADVLRSLSLPVRVDRQPITVIADLVEDGVRRCAADAGLPVERIGGVCVGLPGVIERAAGRVRQSPIFRERDVDFAEALRQRLGVPVSIDSDVNLVTLAEHWFGQARGLDNFLVVSVEANLGLGIMHNGELFRGANGLSPDLGDLLVRPPLNGGISRLGAVASEAAILAEAQALLQGSEHDLAFRSGKGLDTVLALAAQGDERVSSVLAEAGAALGFAIANLIALFAPPKVILTGAVLEADTPLLASLRERAIALVPPSLTDIADIVVHRWDDDMWARGAAAMTLRDLYGAPWSTTGPALRGLPA